MKKMDKVGDTSSKSADVSDDYQRQTILNLYNSDIGIRSHPKLDISEESVHRIIEQEADEVKRETSYPDLITHQKILPLPWQVHFIWTPL